jgi:hypothetical protein
MNNPEDDKLMNNLFETMRASEMQVPVPSFDELVGRAKRQRTKRFTIRMLSWAAVLTLIVIPAAWYSFPSEELETAVEMTEIYEWDAPSDSWFAALNEETEEPETDENEMLNNNQLINENDTL